MEWNRVQDCDGLECVVCGERVGQFGYTLYLQRGDRDDLILAFDRAFAMDALAEFLCCPACRLSYGDAYLGGPKVWLDAYLEEDAKMISREEAMRLLDALTPTPDSPSAGREPHDHENPPSPTT